MTHTEIVKKLIGHINPIGESNVDAEIFENLKQMCELVNNLVAEIDSVAYKNLGSSEHSCAKAGEFAKDFLTNTLGINE